jgi:uncharacterized membrane protein
MQTLEMLYIGGGILLAALSIPLIMRKIKPNPIYGFRTPTTLSNETYWYEVNSYAGKWLLGAGIMIAISAIVLAMLPLSLDTYAILCAVIILGAITIAIVMGVIYMRKLQKQA